MDKTYRVQAVRIGRHLRYIRRVKDQTQEELAETLGVSVGWVSRIERGTKLPNLKYLFRISRALAIPVKELLPA